MLNKITNCLDAKQKNLKGVILLFLQCLFKPASLRVYQKGTLFYLLCLYDFLQRLRRYKNVPHLYHGCNHGYWNSMPPASIVD